MSGVISLIKVYGWEATDHRIELDPVRFLNGHIAKWPSKYMFISIDIYCSKS